MPPSLTTEMGFKGPQLLLSTLAKHYFGTHDTDSAANDELLYASGFKLVKSFLEASSRWEFPPHFMKLDGHGGRYGEPWLEFERALSFWSPTRRAS
ncbi:hypothetical protein FRB91_007741 [Serendipita sp. 411]|nr:hypothetical protein FRB91_007741 [Serendipita sp. 411]